MINQVTLVGYLGKDPEVKHLENGITVAKLNVATSENYKDKAGEWQSSTEWHTVVVWRHLAIKAEHKFKKGSRVYMQGKLTHRRVGEGDATKYFTEVVANKLLLLEKSQNQEGYFPEAAAAPPPPNSIPTTEVKEEVKEDDLPF